MPSSGEVLATIPVGMVPKWVAVGPDGTRAYVTMSNPPGSGPPEGAVAVIDIPTNTLMATIAVGILPSGVVVAPDGRHAYVSNLQHSGGVVNVIDTTSNAVVDSITVSAPTGLPHGLAMTLDGCQLYVVAETGEDTGQGAVKIIDVNTKAIIATVAMAPCESQSDLEITPDGRHAYVTQRPGNSAGGRLLVIDTATQKRVDPPIKVPGSADGLAFMPNGQAAYVSDSRSRAVHVVAVRP